MQRLMISLAKYCKTVPGDIFGASDYELKRLVNLLIFHFFSFNSHHRHNKMLQFWCADGSDSEEDKEELIKVEAMPIYVSVSSGDDNVARGCFHGYLCKILDRMTPLWLCGRHNSIKKNN